MKIAVLKFGGTSLKGPHLEFDKGFSNAGDQIIKLTQEGWKVVCVLSAYAGSTDELIRMAKKIDPVPDPRATDFLVSTGEQVSVGLMAIYLRKKGISCECLTGWQAGILTTSIFSKASIKKIRTTKTQKLLNDKDVIIVTGFQGITVDQDITTLGRGGSDTSAIALAIALKAKLCEIRTDVNGIYTSNPRNVTKARLIDKINYDELLEMASSGAKVIDPRAVELAKIYRFRFVVRHHTHNNGKTIVRNISKKENNVVAIVSNSNCTIMNLQDVPNVPGTATKITEIIANNSVKLGFVLQPFSNERFNNISFLIWEKDINVIKALKKMLKTEILCSDVLFDQEIGAVSIISSRLLSQVGMAAECTSKISELNIPIIAVTTSNIRITFIVHKSNVNKLTYKIHETYT